MKLSRVQIDPGEFPEEIRGIVSGARVYDSSSSGDARVLFIESGRGEKGGGHFLKTAAKGALGREADMTRLFCQRGLSSKVLSYISTDRDWLLTERIPGADCTSDAFLDSPKRLADTLGENLAMLHSLDSTAFPDCTKAYLERVGQNFRDGIFDAGRLDSKPFPSPAFATAHEAYAAVLAGKGMLASDTLIHGDYCLPNIILDAWRFSGYVDLGYAGAGDRHVDLYWGAWSLAFNLKTDRHSDRFFDAYGRGKIDMDVLRLVSACEAFG